VRTSAFWKLFLQFPHLSQFAGLPPHKEIFGVQWVHYQSYKEPSDDVETIQQTLQSFFVIVGTKSGTE
jgi:hypothetical protein